MSIVETSSYGFSEKWRASTSRIVSQRVSGSSRRYCGLRSGKAPRRVGAHQVFYVVPTLQANWIGR